MAKSETSEKSKRVREDIETINVGIFGHIDHGKTTLLHRLSGKWADTHSEELKRGITIKLGYADVTIYEDKGKLNIEGKGKPIRQVSFIDCPGHEMLMATTLSGAAIIDLAILVIAANEGILSQTREHLMALKAKKVNQFIVVQNKIDLVAKERALENYKEIVKLLEDSSVKADVVPVCAQQGVNVDKVLEKIASANVPERDLSQPPVFLVARSFDVNKPGTTPDQLSGAVLGGSLKKGEISLGDEIEIKPGRVEVVDGQKKYVPIKTKVRGLFKGSSKVEKLTPGGSVAIETSLDMSLGKNDKLAGNLVSTLGGLPEPRRKIKLKYTLFPKVFGLAEQMDVEELKQGELLMLSINTSITGGNVESIANGEAVVSLRVPAVFFANDTVGIARNIRGHWRLIGYGEAIE